MHQFVRIERRPFMGFVRLSMNNSSQKRFVMINSSEDPFTICPFFHPIITSFFMVAIPNVVNIIIIVCCAISAFIGGVAHAFMCDALDRGGIDSGSSPEDWATRNGTMYSFLFALVMAVVLFLLAVMEIVLLFINLEFLAFLKKGFLLPILYICFGVMTLAAAADLGIAAGSLLIIFGAIRLLLSIIGGGGK